jgi:putative phosphoesterase
MKLALLSDIHGNQYALSKVVDEIRKENIDTLIIAGDTVGYYYGIKDVLNLIANFKIYFTKGNHEMMLEQLRFNPIIELGLTNKYGSSLRLALNSLSETEIDQLLNLEHPKSITIENLDILISHGSPWDINQYLYPDSDKSIWDNFLHYEEDIFIVGHTHYQHTKKIGNKIIINPGSVGQNRLKVGLADWAIFDTESLSVTNHSTPYPVEKLIDECMNIDPDVKLLTKQLGYSD